MTTWLTAILGSNNPLWIIGTSVVIILSTYGWGSWLGSRARRRHLQKYWTENWEALHSSTRNDIPANNEPYRDLMREDRDT